MGKGNRARTTRATDVIASSVTPKKQKTPASKQNKITAIVTAVVVLLLVGCIVLSAVYSTGFNLRARSAAKSENYKVTGTMMSYFFRTQYNYFLQQYSSYISYFGIDTGSSLKTQYADADKKQTWFDYFMESAKTEVEQILIFCENAKIEGLGLTDEQKTEIDGFMDELAKSAASYGYTVNSYAAAMYGTGVNANDIKEAIELTYIGENFRKVLNDRLTAAVTEDDINAYYTANPASFLTADILSYSFKATLTMAGAEATDEEKAQYDTDKAAMKKLAGDLAALKTESEFKAYVLKYVIDNEASALFDGYYKTNSASFTDADKPADGVLDTDKAAAIEYVRATVAGETPAAPAEAVTTYEKAIATCRTSLLTEIQKRYDAVTVDGHAYADPKGEDTAALDVWLFDGARAVNDTTVIDDEGESSSTYTAHLVRATSHRDESVTQNVAHILFTADKYGTTEAAKAKAEEILAQYKAGELTYDAFEKLGEENTEDSSVSYDNVKSGQMVASFNDWIFDASRKEGDVDIVETEYGFHVMYYRGLGDTVWHITAKSGAVEEDYDAWFTEQQTKFPVTFNSAAINAIEG